MQYIGKDRWTDRQEEMEGGKEGGRGGRRERESKTHVRKRKREGEI